MLGIVPHCEQTAMDLGVERLDPPVHHLWKAGEVTDVPDVVAHLAQLRRRATGRDQLHFRPGQAGGKDVEPGFVGKRDERPANGHDASHQFILLA